MMLKNTYKDNVVKLAQQIKKEHFLKLGLWIAGISLTIIWLAMLLATSISGGAYKVYGEAIEIKTQQDFNLYISSGYEFFIENNNVIKAHKLLSIKDYNPLCLTYDSNLTGWYICILLTPIGYLGIIFLIAWLKNMITPQQIKRTIRRALQFGYLKQKDVDYVIDEIDYNIGLKKRESVIIDSGEGENTNPEN